MFGSARWWLLAVAVLACVVPATAPAADGIDESSVILVEAGPYPRSATVIHVDAAQAADAHVVVVDPDGNQIPLQRVSDDAAVFRLAAPLEAGETAGYRVLRLADANPQSPAEMTCREDQGALVIASRGREIVRYHAEEVDPPEGIDAIYRRSGHIHPVRTPSGRIVTEEFPADHPHQHGIFSAWVNTTFEGRSIDFWNQKAATGTVRHVRVDELISGPCVAQFTATQRHVDITDPERLRSVLADEWTVTAYEQPQQDADYFLFDIASRQIGIAETPLSIREYHYGGMAFRGAAEWFGQPEHDFLTSEGLTRTDGNHSRPRWVCAHGIVDDATCCLTIIGHPDNFRAPQPVRLHPNKPYFVFSPPVLGAFEIGPDAAMLARYRYVVHDGPPQPELYERLWRDFSEPPQVRVVAPR